MNHQQFLADVDTKLATLHAEIERIEELRREYINRYDLNRNKESND